MEIKYTGVDFNVVMDPSMNHLCLMTSDTGQSSSSPRFPFGSDLRSASHSDPTHV
jgi:hypothetical protein